MSDADEETVEEKLFSVDRAKQSRAACKKCKQKCLSGELRIAKLAPSPYGSGKMKNWHHVDCIFEQFLKQRQTTKRIESPDDLDGWEVLNDEDKELISNKIEECDKLLEEKHGSSKTSHKKTKSSPKSKKSPIISNSNNKIVDNTSDSSSLSTKDVSIKSDDLNISSSSISNYSSKKKDTNKYLLFREFRRLVADISNVNSYLDKTNHVRKIFAQGSDGISFKGDITLWCRLLLPGDIKRTYNLQSKQIIKLFSRLFNTDQNAMLEHLEEGDVGETIQYFFEQSPKFKPASKSMLTVQEVDEFLEELTKLTKEDDQLHHFKMFASKCTSNDLKIVVRLIKGDLRMNARAKHILDGVHPDAYAAFQASRDINAVIKRCLGDTGIGSTSISVEATVTLMTPVLPMLAEACKSVEQAMKKCPNGMYSEIKYDGERVQLHKKGVEFKYFSRSLKPVMAHKVAHFKEFIPKAFPRATDLILDSEILLIDTQTGKPLPFGSLGVHKKSEFKDANVCLFVFDCMYYNGQVLTNKPISYRKKILRENMTEIPNHIMFSEMKEIHKPDDLKAMIVKVLKLGLEGLVLKDLCSIYEPGKRHWLKVKKDYLFDGAMADSADLIVLGAWYGTGKKGGMMSVFLMGCYDSDEDKFCTVTKVHTGHDDKTLEKLQTELEMIKISCDMSKVPDWLRCTRSMVPDFVAIDPKKQPVWEITGAEFTQHDVHTADGISIRFPRVTKIRDDKTWKTATNLLELKELYKKSKENTDVSLLMKISKSEDDDGDENKNNNVEKKKKPATVPKRKHEEEKQPEKKKAKIDETVNADSVCVIQKPLPDYFKNVKLLVEDVARPKHKEWLRYFVAFGGTILEPGEWEQATHVLHLKDTVAEPCVQAPVSAKHVIVEWIRDTVAKKSLQDFKPYTVRWKPSLKET